MQASKWLGRGTFIPMLGVHGDYIHDAWFTMVSRSAVSLAAANVVGAECVPV